MLRKAAGGDGGPVRTHRRGHPGVRAAAQGHHSIRVPVVRSIRRVKVTVVITHGRIIVWRERPCVTEHGLQVLERWRAGLVLAPGGTGERALPVQGLRLQAVGIGEIKSGRSR